MSIVVQEYMFVYWKTVLFLKRPLTLVSSHFLSKGDSLHRHLQYFNNLKRKFETQKKNILELNLKKGLKITNM